jgi:ATP-dependent protease ClpP protease subunit
MLEAVAAPSGRSRPGSMASVAVELGNELPLRDTSAPPGTLARRQMRRSVLAAAVLATMVAQVSGPPASGSERPSPPHRRDGESWWDLRCDEGGRGGDARGAPGCVLTVRLRGRMERVRLRQIEHALERRDEAVRTRGRKVALHVDIDSEGGEMYPAMEIGRILRTEQASLTVARGSQCISACVLVLMGATDRTVDVGARVGIHRPSFREAGKDGLIDAMEDSIAAYADRMTGQHRIVDDMMLIPSDQVHLLTPADFTGYGIAVTISRPRRR